MALNWDNLLLDLEQATLRLRAVAVDDVPRLQKALATRADAIARVQEALATEPAPAGICGRLESILAVGEAAAVRLLVRRNALHATWSGLAREAQWLQQTRLAGRSRSHAVDCSG